MGRLEVMGVLDLSARELAGMIDHTFLKPFGTPSDIEKLCEEAVRYGFGAVMVNVAELERALRLVGGSVVRVGCTVAFPLGQGSSEARVFEARDAIERGAQELDTVLNIRALQAGDLALVRRQLGDLAGLCRGAGVVSKVILETCYLTDEQKRLACEIAVECGIDFVKTSTGLATGGATVADVRLMRAVVGQRAGVKASGGIRALSDVRALVEAGANRIGTSNGVGILAEWFKESGVGLGVS